MRRRVPVSLLELPLAAVGLLATGFSPAAIVVVALAAVTPWLIGIDIREHRLPNALVLPGIIAGLVSCAVGWIASGRVPLVPLIAGAAYGGFLLLMHVVGGMGMGDVKLGAALGLASWTLSVAVLSPAIAFLTGGIVSIVLLLTGGRGRRIAFGPFLLGGFWAAIALRALAGI